MTFKSECILGGMNEANSHTIKMRSFFLGTLLLAGALFVSLYTPVCAYGVPKISVQKKNVSLKKSVSSASFTLKSSENATLKMVVRDSAGRYVKAAKKTLKKNKSATISWNGRYSSDNALKKPYNDYVASGTYRVELRVTGKTGTSSVYQKVKVSANSAPKISSVKVPSSMTPSGKKGTKAFKSTFKVSKTNDVVATITQKSSRKVIYESKYRDQKANVTRAIYWDGQIKKSKVIKLADGSWAMSGDIAPAGTYVLTIKSRGKSVTKNFTVKKAKPTGLTIRVPQSTMMYGAHQTLVAVVTPRGSQGTSVKWTSSNTALATVDSKGVVTAKSGKEGSVKITAQSTSYATLKKTVTIAIRSQSTLKIKDCAVTKWCIHKASKTILGSVTSNSPIKWVKMTIENSEGASEISKTVSVGDSRYPRALTTFNIKTSMDPYIPFGKLTPGKKRLVVTACDEMVTRELYTQDFWVIGPTKYQSFWQDRKNTWVYPLDVKRPGNTSSFGSYRDGGARAHAAIDLIESVNTKVYAMSDGVVERISVGTYYAGTGAVQVKHSDGSVMWYCEVKAASGLRVGSKVKKNQVIAVIQRNNYGTSMLHLEAYSGKATGNLYVSENMTYDNVTPVRYNRRRDLISPMGVLDLAVPATRTVN